MELKYLKEFVELADIGNYTVASKKLNVSQSVLSKHIKSMENELGTTLFNRSKQGITLSASGMIFLPYARKVVKLQSDWQQALWGGSEEKKILKVASIPGMTKLGVTNLLSSFTEKNEDVKLKIMEESTDWCIESLHSGDSDVAFVGQVISRYPELIYIPYKKDRMLAYMPKDHPLAEKQGLSLQDLEQEKLIFPEPSSSLYRFLYEACENEGFEPEIVTTNNNFRHSIMMVSKDVGIALLSELTCLGYAKKTAGICSRNLTPEISTTIYCCYDPEKISSIAEKFVREVILKSRYVDTDSRDL